MAAAAWPLGVIDARLAAVVIGKPGARAAAARALRSLRRRFGFPVLSFPPFFSGQGVAESVERKKEKCAAGEPGEDQKKREPGARRELRGRPIRDKKKAKHSSFPFSPEQRPGGHLLPL